MLRVTVNDKNILLANINNEIFAIDDMCTHEDASLYKGALKGHCVECPLHGSLFDLHTGKPDGNPLQSLLIHMILKLQMKKYI